MRAMPWGPMLLCWVLQAGTGNAHLSRAIQLMDQELDFASADRELEAALATPENDRATLLAIFERQALLAVYLQEPARATAAYKRILVLEPGYRVPGTYGPKAEAPFGEAKRWFERYGGLRFVERPQGDRPTAGLELSVKVASDPLGMASRVRFHLRVPGAAWRATTVSLSAGVASTAARGDRTEWWAQLLDGTGAALATLGSAEAPLVCAVRGAAAATRPPLEEPPASMAKAEAPSVGAAARGSGTAAFILSGAAVTGAAAFAYLSAQTRSGLYAAERNADGVVTGLSQRDAFALDQRASAQGTWSAGLFGVGAALAATGAALVWHGVTASPGPGGVAVHGELP